MIVVRGVDGVLRSPDGDYVLRTHAEDDECREFGCVVHNPTDHHMKDWTLNWRTDTGVMERLDPAEGVGHPDPDALAWAKRHDMSWHGVHGCWITDSGHMACHPDAKDRRF